MEEIGRIYVEYGPPKQVEILGNPDGYGFTFEKIKVVEDLTMHDEDMGSSTHESVHRSSSKRLTLEMRSSNDLENNCQTFVDSVSSGSPVNIFPLQTCSFSYCATPGPTGRITTWRPITSN